MNRLSSILAFVFMLIVGLTLGVWATARVLDSAHVPGAMHYGPWVTWPNAGIPEADPYSAAAFARRGDIPMAPSEGLALFASRDSDGSTLRGGCHYEIGGIFPQARAWTLTVYKPDGRLMIGPSGRSAFTSAEALVEEGRVRIQISAQPQPGNWLPLAPQGDIVLALRLYETPLSAVAAALDVARLPVLRKLACS